MLPAEAVLVLKKQFFSRYWITWLVYTADSTHFDRLGRIEIRHKTSYLITSILAVPADQESHAYKEFENYRKEHGHGQIKVTKLGKVKGIGRAGWIRTAVLLSSSCVVNGFAKLNWSVQPEVSQYQPFDRLFVKLGQKGCPKNDDSNCCKDDLDHGEGARKQET